MREPHDWATEIRSEMGREFEDSLLTHQAEHKDCNCSPTTLRRKCRPHRFQADFEELTGYEKGSSEMNQLILELEVLGIVWCWGRAGYSYPLWKEDYIRLATLLFHNMRRNVERIGDELIRKVGQGINPGLFAQWLLLRDYDPEVFAMIMKYVNGKDPSAYYKMTSYLTSKKYLVDSIKAPGQKLLPGIQATQFDAADWSSPGG